ncbi:MAG: hypothetical protein KAX44_02700 [Candidatus Brocadiae bacterium]|nr:hypothetical protein [Candidatus Brocadiia bacterium]
MCARTNRKVQSVMPDLPSVQRESFTWPEGKRSYVPVIARHFIVGRGARDETHNHPLFCDLAQATGLDADGAEPGRLMDRLHAAVADGGWLILTCHDVADEGRQTTLAEALDGLCRYAAEPANGIWVDTVEAIGAHIQEARPS